MDFVYVCIIPTYDSIPRFLSPKTQARLNIHVNPYTTTATSRMTTGRSTSRTGSVLESSRSDVAALCLQLLVEVSQRHVPWLPWLCWYHDVWIKKMYAKSGNSRGSKQNIFVVIYMCTRFLKFFCVDRYLEKYSNFTDISRMGCNGQLVQIYSLYVYAARQYASNIYTEYIYI